jgi:hypothetical protein
MQLACGWAFGGEGWGHLHKMDDATLRETIDDMVACWQANPELTRESAGLNPSDEPPWFAEYADDPHKLFAEAHKDRSFMQWQSTHGGYYQKAREEFEAQYTTPAPHAPAAVDQ